MTTPAIPGMVHGAGLGLRRVHLDAFATDASIPVDFVEVAPENWLDVGGRLGRRFRAVTERYPLVCHGLSLSLGGPEPLDREFLGRLRRFLDEHDAVLYSEHLSACSDHAHLYDLMPIPFTDAAVAWVVRRIREVQDILERPLVIEQVSYYAAPGQQMSEQAFLLAVLAESRCPMLLDVNNLYVNSVNHGYDPAPFLASLPGDQIAYLHVAGHYDEAPGLKIDTHGAAVIDPVWALLGDAYRLHGVRPTLLERDFNIPPLPRLLDEVETIRRWQGLADGVSARAAVR